VLPRIAQVAMSAGGIHGQRMAPAYAIVEIDAVCVGIVLGIEKEKTNPGTTFQSIQATTVKRYVKLVWVDLVHDLERQL
jgi:hypothetical protein